MKGVATLRDVVAMLCVTMLSALAFAGSAFAAEIDAWGAQTTLPESSAEADADVNLVFLSGAAGDTVFLNVSDDSKTLVKNLAHALGEGGQTGDSVADVFSMKLPGGLNEDKLESGAYTVEVAATRNGSPMFRGTLYGVWARLDGGATQLIGTRVASDGGAYQFVPPNVVYQSGTAYQLASTAPDMQGNAAYYDYASFNPEDTVDGQITYVDQAGSTVKVETFPVATDGTATTHEIPATINAEGKLYRTIARTSSVQAVYPTQTSFTVPCLYMHGAPYLAKINMVDESGEVIASDSVNVDGTYAYTAPRTIYKRVEVGGETRAVAYTLDDDEVWPLDSEADLPLVVNGVRTITIKYARQSIEEGEIAVTFYQLDAQDDPSKYGKLLGSQTATVTKDQATAAPDERIVVDGTTYVLVSDVSECTYTYGSGELPVIDAYYLPEGYGPGEPYTVTVNYVNYVTGSVIRSTTFESRSEEVYTPLEPPATFTESGVEYVRLAGQADLEHNYYSRMDTYTVYYRDANDTLSEGVVIERTRVITRGVTTTVTQGGGTTTSTAATPGGAAANGAGAVPISLNPDRGYNAIGGTGDRTLVNDRGQDANTERSGDDQTPLAQGQGDNAVTPPSDEGGLVAGGIAAAVVVAIAVLAALLWWLLVARRRNEDES